MMQENYFIGSLQFFKRFFIGLFLLSYPFFVNADIILSENFSSGVIPSGWTVTPLQGSANWQVRNAPIMNSPSAGHY
ncbi:MAG: hypothetical protein JJT77_07450, partial [Crocinitomicaceae bacterium]|nr:hypothetical protein [Crocinitomicaceae bacterium]